MIAPADRRERHDPDRQLQAVAHACPTGETALRLEPRPAGRGCHSLGVGP